MKSIDRVLLAALTLDGAIVAVLSIAFTYVYVGSVPFPAATVIGGLLNLGLVWLAAATTHGAARFAPLAAWSVVVFAALLGGPGGDGVLQDWRILALIGFGVGVPVIASWSGRLPTPTRDTPPRPVVGPR
ncbi:facilitated glucose transporter [Williamsia sp. CHRR-6]|uniref:facilitated glucose transporter n=1 Tax=Williamsia sp. CHRR-6 TaxID=2835871 RepID=UPI001BDB1301|nr:facilitated glucose transporter [Williamsia sp. CHRR-6]MBT0565529.1 facilitated glucose transporter [Williamsia sp. CHRR-6]